uniref:Androgen-dependent TFPI-regulating protein n=1 Tax=Strigamia maritima TaxID=126957 RepID=T1JCY0_STRMM
MKKHDLFVLGLHSIWTATYAYAIYYDVNFVKIPGHNVAPRNYAGRWKYLTFWNAVLQVVFYGVCLVCDVISHKQLHRFKDFFFATIVFPLTLFVFLTFWGLYLVDRRLIFPVILDKYFPNWLNQVLHTMIVPTTLLELYLKPHKYPSRTTGTCALLLFITIYTYWTLHLAYFAGIWVYPIFEVLDWTQRAVFFLFGFVVFLSLYVIGEKLNASVWTKAKPKQHKTK